MLVQVDKDGLVEESNESNNSFSTTWTCFLVVKPIIVGPVIGFFKPDLLVTSVWESGDRVFYRIENIGTAASEPCSAELYRSGHLISTDANIPAIEVGGFVERKFTQTFSCVLPTLAPVEVLVDTDDDNTESDETNNSYATTLMCH